MSIKRLLVAGVIVFILFYLIQFIESKIPPLPFSLLTILYPLVILFALKLNNEGKKFFLSLSISIVFLYFSFAVLPEIKFLRLIGVAAIALFYFLRFYFKNPKRISDFLKLLLVLLFSFFISYEAYLSREYNPFYLDFFLSFIHQTGFVVGWLLLILEKLKIQQLVNSPYRPFVIVFYLFLSSSSIGSILFAIIQKTEADKQREISIKEKIEAEQERQRAIKEKLFYQKRMQQLEDSLEYYRKSID